MLNFKLLLLGHARKESSMRLRMMLAVCGGFALMAATRTIAQNAPPFTIRFPPDGATVRENVAVKVPLASIPEGAYVAYSVNGIFRVALSPTAEQREKAKAGDPFTWTWDTKASVLNPRTNKEEVATDGTYTIAVSLYTPLPGNAGGSKLAQTSSVKVTLNNIIRDDPGPLKFRYRFPDGSSRTYGRNGATKIVAGMSQGIKGTGDIEVVGQNSDILMAVEDAYDNGNAIVRNRLTRLVVRQSGQETTYPMEQLPKSIYQELDARGSVVYPTESTTRDAFWGLGVPVSATLDLPELPSDPKSIGDTWKSNNVVLDIPGTSPEQQPKVTADTKFVGLEWEQGFKTAHLQQTYKGGVPGKDKQVTFSGMQIESPSITFVRDIYIAYSSGTLVKVERNIEVTGKTSQSAGGTMGAPGMGGMPGMPSMGGGMTGPGMLMGRGGMGGDELAGGPSMAGMSMGVAGGPGGMMPGMPRMGGGMSGGMPGIPGMGSGGGMTGPGGMSGPGMMMGGRGRGRRGMGMPSMGSGMSGMPGPGGMGMGAPGMGGVPGGNTGTSPTSQQITVKSKTVTELQIKK